jgi:hypothetical protein
MTIDMFLIVYPVSITLVEMKILGISSVSSRSIRCISLSNVVAEI